MQKYPSNIVEKFLEKDYKIGLLKFVEELSKSDLIAGKFLLLLILFYIKIYHKNRTNKEQFWKLCSPKGIENCKKFNKNSINFDYQRAKSFINY